MDHITSLYKRNQSLFDLKIHFQQTIGNAL